MRRSSSTNTSPLLESKARKLGAPVIAVLIVFAVALMICLLALAAQHQLIAAASMSKMRAQHDIDRSLNARLSTAASGAGLGARGDQLVSTICEQYTAYPDVYAQGLSSSQIPLTLDVVSYAVQAAAMRANEAQSLATKLSREKDLSLLEHQCAMDCVELLESVKDQLHSAVSRLSRLGRALDTSVPDPLMIRDVKVWLSASLSYQMACTDNFQEAPGSIQEQIQSDQDRLAEAIGNAFSLVDTLSQLVNDITTPWQQQGGAAPPAPPSSPPFSNIQQLRRPSSPPSTGAASFQSTTDSSLYSSSSILGSVIDDGDEFPYWVSVADRELLLLSPCTPVNANAVVAQDGSGSYADITAALNAIPSTYTGRYVIYIKQGVYAEVFNLSKHQQNITLVGDGIGKTVITGDRNVASGQYNTYRTSTVGLSGSGFYARDLTFRNTAGPSGHQAVALRAGADFVAFCRCSFEAYQDTLYALTGRQFYRECQISGTVDFIFGNAIAVFQNCVLLARLPLKGQKNTYTAQGRKLAADISGYSFHNCTVGGDSSLANASYSVSTYLGRPWKAYSRVVFLQSDMEALVDPQGWLPWNSSNPFTDTLYYGEYDNRGPGSGPGSNTSQRVNWVGVHPNMSQADASQFTVESFIDGETWLDPLHVTYQPSLSPEEDA